MNDHGGIPEDYREELQGDMVFRLDPLDASRLMKDEPMWSPGGSRDLDWILSEE